jgi:hypothetical protein
MRVLILIAAADAASADEVAMRRYHDELLRAGVLLAGDLTAGFWLLEVDSRAEATEWGRRLPCPDGDVEIREVTTTR